MINPTGGKIRIDSKGSGVFLAPRETRTHKGTDYECEPGQDVKSPISGRVIRVAYPYAHDPNYSGVYIQSDDIGVKMFYLQPDLSLVGKLVAEGDVIGTAQDISKKYGPDMKPHCHVQIENINPDYVINLANRRE